MKELEKIFIYEDNKNYKLAYECYKILFLKNSDNYDIWKHYYFFIWLTLDDGIEEYENEININKILNSLLEYGQVNFNQITDLNFILGYTMSVTPFVFGDYFDYEKKGNNMLLKASLEEPENIIYKVFYLGSVCVENIEYIEMRHLHKIYLKNYFRGEGLLNAYFRQIFE